MNFRADGALDHSQSQCRLGRKAAIGAVDLLVRRMRFRHARVILRPALRQIKLAVDEGMAALRDIAGEDADLAIRDLARRARILTRDAAGRLALFQETRLVDDEDRVGVGERFQRIVADDVAQSVHVPLRTPEDRLLSPRPRIARCFRPHPTSLAPLFPQQAVEKMLGRPNKAILFE
jgi:hypothetical protein